MSVPRWAWWAWVLGFVVLELVALLNGTPGDTLSGLVQALIADYPWTASLFAAGLGWLTWHWLVDDRSRR